VVAIESGFTEPLSVAAVVVTPEAALVVARGGPAVVNVWFAPSVVPLLFVATILKS
jgi:hypothetical protein